MVKELKNRSFPDRSITDFKDYWSVKLSKFDSCVFPQIEKNIATIFPLKIKAGKEAVAENRIYFVIIPKNTKITSDV